MSNYQQQSFMAVSLNEVADPSQLWEMILEEVILPEGADDTIWSGDQV